MKLRDSERTVVTLANGAELVRQIGQAVLGNDVADTFNGSPITRAMLYDIAQTQFQNAVTKKIGVL